MIFSLILYFSIFPLVAGQDSDTALVFVEVVDSISISVKSDLNFGNVEPGDKLTVDQFEAGDLVNVSGVSKGKGFAGNVKRHNHATGPKTHGSRAYRIPGSIGATDASRVFKGQKLPGRMGHDQVQMENLQIVKVMKEDNVLLVKGSIPGPKKGIITIESID